MIASPFGDRRTLLHVYRTRLRPQRWRRRAFPRRWTWTALAPLPIAMASTWPVESSAPEPAPLMAPPPIVTPSAVPPTPTFPGVIAFMLARDVN